MEKRDFSESEMSQWVGELFERHPLAESVDVYKQAHQAMFGPGHLLVDEAVVRMRLTQEAQALEMDPRDWEEVIEVIHPSLEMARVHLRPYLRSGGSVQRLVEAMFKTEASLGEPDSEALARLLGAARAALPGVVPESFDMEAFDTLLRAQVAEGFGVVHHSDVYRQTYDPHYRVVLLEALG